MKTQIKNSSPLSVRGRPGRTQATAPSILTSLSSGPEYLGSEVPTTSPSSAQARASWSSKLRKASAARG